MRYLLIIIVFSNVLFAQWNTSGSNIYTTTYDKVGIGASTPHVKLHIIRSSVSNRHYDSYATLITEYSENRLQIISKDSGKDASVLILSNVPTTGANKHWLMAHRGTTYSDRLDIGYKTTSMTGNVGGYQNFVPDLTILNTGEVGIGTTNPQSLLAVNGTITAQEITVTETGWPDFVFEEDYDLKPLIEVEQFIKNNKHLPEIPSEKEVKENGVSLGEMQSKLLQKVEELTLYMIEQNKKLEKLEKLEKENDALKQRLNNLEELN